MDRVNNNNKPASNPPGEPASAAIETLYSAFFETLASRVRARFGNGPPDPEDVAQTAFLKLFRNGNWQSISNPQAYLLRTANNFVISEMRAIGVRARHADQVKNDNSQEEEGSTLDLERVFTNRELLEQISRVIDNLTDRQRRIFEMKRFDELSLSEIARREGISRTAVSKHLTRAVAAVDGYLADYRS